MTAHSESTEAEISRLRDLALLDELTGLANRRAFLERLHEAFARACAGGPAFSLVLMDLDGLKDINDTLGYSAGDRALVQFGAALSGAVRGGDLVARIGGDEFAVVAQHPVVAEAERLVGRLREVAGGVVRSLKTDGPDVILSAAVGHGAWGAAIPSVEAIFTLAETEMAATKASPRSTKQSSAAVFRPRGRRALGEELRSLLAMARQVTSTTGDGDLLRRTAEQATALVGAESAAIALVDGAVVRIDEVWSEGRWQPFASERPFGEGVLGRVAATGIPIVENALRPDQVHDWLGAVTFELRSLLCVPLRDRQGTTFGVLALGNKRGNQDFAEADIGLAQAFSDLAAAALENMRSFTATEEARAYQRALMEQARDAILVVDPLTGYLLDANLAMEQLTDYRREELLRLTLQDLAPGLAGADGVDQGEAQSPLVMLPEGIRRRDGARIPVELSATRVQTERGPQILVILRDIRERLAAEAALRTANERLQALTEQAGDAIIRGDLEGQLLDANAMAEQVFGMERAILQRLRMPELVDPSERDRIPLVHRTLRRRGRTRLTVRLRRADGTPFAAEVSASIVGDEIILIIRDITQRLAAEAETRQRNEELEARNRVAALLTESQSIEAALASALPIITRAGEMDGALVMLADDGGRLRLVAGLDVPPELARVLTDSPPRLGERLTGGAAAGRTPILIQDAATDPRLHWQETRDSGLRSLAILPLVVDNRALGVLGAGSYEVNALDDRRVARLRAFADQVAVWLDSRLLLEATRAREQEARFLADLGESLNQTHDEQRIVERLVADVAAKFGGGAVVLLREADARWSVAARAHMDPVMRAPLDELAQEMTRVGDYATLAERLRPSLIDLTAGPLPGGSHRIAPGQSLGLETLITVPLSAGGELLGLLAIGNRAGEPPLTRRHLALAQEVAQHAALAVANARAYAEAAESQASLRSMMERAAEAILLFDAGTGTIVDANAAAETLTGRGRAELVGLAPRDLVPARELPKLTGMFAALAAGEGTVERRTVRLRRADGRTFTAHVNASRVAVRGGPAVMALLRDMTADLAAQRQRERLLRRARDEAERSQHLLELAGRLTRAEGPDGVMRTALEACGWLARIGRAALFLWDRDRRVFAAGETMGLSAEERAALSDYVLDEQTPGYGELLRAAEPAVIRDLAQHAHADQAIVAAFGVRSAAVIQLRAGGELLGFLAADRTAREQPFSRRDLAMLTGIAQQTATALAAARARARAEETRDYLQTVMDYAGDGIVVTDIATELVVDVNDRFCDMIGRSREQVIGGPLTALVMPEQRQAAAARLAGLRAGAALTAIRRRDLQHADGGAVPVELSNSRVAFGGRDLLVGVVRDLRGQIETERQLRFQAQVLENMRDAVVALDREGRVLVWNRGAEELFGWTAEEMFGTMAQESVTAGGLPYLNALVRHLSQEPVASGDVPFARKDGTRMQCQVTLTRLSDEHGAPIGLIGIVRDLTDERQAAARLTEANATATRRTSELRAVADIAGILVGGGHPDRVFDALARRILETGTFDIATISLYDAERDAISLRQIQHRLSQAPEALAGARGRWLPAAGLPLLQRAMQERRPLVVHEGDALWRASTLGRWNTSQDRLRLTVAVPLLYQDELIGTLVLYAREDRPVPPDETRLLQALADQVAVAVHAARNVS